MKERNYKQMFVHNDFYHLAKVKSAQEGKSIIGWTEKIAHSDDPVDELCKKTKRIKGNNFDFL